MATENDDDGIVFFEDLLEEANLASNSDDASAASKQDDLSDAASVSSTETIDQSNQRDNYWDPTAEIPPSDQPVAASNSHESEGAERVSMSDVTSTDATNQNDNNGPPETNQDIPKGRSIAHYHIKGKTVHLISADIETAGAAVGAIQLSAEHTKLKIVQTGKSISKDTATNIERNDDTFNEFINPGSDMHDYWSERSMAVHGLNPNSPKIRDAEGINVVWDKFCKWVDRVIPNGEVAILVAWNGEACDLKWFWEITQAPNSPYQMPPKIKYFIDPYRMITKYTSCPINPKISKIESLELGSVWKYCQGENFNGAHNSLRDSIGQTDIMIHKHVIPFIDRTNTIQHIADIFTKKQQDEWKKKMEPVRPVHEPWQEQTKDSNITWSAPWNHCYTGPRGGPKSAPTTYIRDVVRHANTLACIFLAIIPLTFWNKVAAWSHKYYYEDFVVETTARDRDGNEKKKKYFKPCSRNTPGARRRGEKERVKYKWTASFAICWVAILIIQGAHFGSQKRSSRKMWRAAPHGLSIPYIRNSMRRDAYEFARRSIHFCDNAKQVAKGRRGYDVLFKVRYAMEMMIDGIQKSWNAGKQVTIDESMIRYNGRAVSYVQYNPQKPIKHGIKVFAICDALTAIMIAWIVYVGKEDDVDGSAVAVCDRLINRANLVNSRGRVLYTDNWYTSMSLAIHMRENYGWGIVGTINPTDKKARADHDIPFLKLSKGALDTLKRGWFREAVIVLKAKNGMRYYIQCCSWKDKKQVVFLNSNEVGFSDGTTVRRHRRGQRMRELIYAPNTAVEYAEYYSAVDRNDRDSADFSTSIRTNRYYIRIFCWSLDRVVHAVYVIVCFCSAQLGIGRDEWSRYRDRTNGRHDFQIDLGISLLNLAIETEWDGKGQRPDWMRQTNFVPCDCKKCYFCLNGITNGLAHADSVKKRKVEVVLANNVRIKTTMCTDVRVGLKGGSEYCRMCYRKHRSEFPHLASTAIKRMCNYSSKGCAQCEEKICSDCWSKGYDFHDKSGIECELMSDD